MARQRTGIMGGTFDPVHAGHIAVARSVADQLELDRVLFMPAGNPHFKIGQDVSPVEDRVEMVRLAIEGVPGFELDLREVRRPGVTYTADTLEEMSSECPATDLFFIVGTDSALTLPKWKDSGKIASLCTVVVAKRPGERTDQAAAALDSSSEHFKAVYLDVPQVDVSSTMVRDMAAAGKSLAGIVPEKVEAYIEAAGLYSR